MAEDRTRSWQELCFAAATESDPDKLLEILALLSSAVVDRQKQLTAGNAQLRGAKIRKHREAPALASVEALLPACRMSQLAPCVNLNCITTGCGTVLAIWIQ